MGSRYEVHISAPSGTTQEQAFSAEELAAASALAGVDINTLTPAEQLAWVAVVRAQQQAAPV